MADSISKLVKALSAAGVKNAKTGKAITSSDVSKVTSSSSKTSSSKTSSSSSSSKTTTAPATTTASKPFNVMDYVTKGREADAQKIISSMGGGSTAPTTTAPTATPGLNTYNYIDAAGNMKQVQAASPAEAMKNATNIAKTSGVQLVTGGTPTATSSDEIRQTIEEAEKKDVPLDINEYTTYEDFQKKILPKAEAPKLPAYEDKYIKLRKEQGISALEDTVNEYDEEVAYLEENLRKFKRNEMSGQALGFAQGRISVEQQGIQDQLDFIARQQNAAINKINTKNKFIENIMNFTKQDYETANDAYQTEFNRNMQMQSAFSTEQNRIRDDARATLTTINNMVTNSGKSMADLDPTMKANINTLELQGGLPVGTFETFATSKPKANIISTQNGADSNGNEFVSFISKDPDTGELSMEKMYTGGKAAPSKNSGAVTSGNLTLSSQDIASGVSALESSRGEDGYVNSETYQQMYNMWTQGGGLPQDFVKTYPPEYYANPRDRSLPNILRP